jgi:glucosylceramidase
MLNKKIKKMGMLTMLLAVVIGGCTDYSFQKQSDSTSQETAVVATSLTTTPGVVNQIVTHGDKSALLKELPTAAFGTTTNSYPTVELNSSSTFQSMDGFGYTLTEGSAYVLMTQMTSTQRTSILNEMFHPTNGIGSSFVRIGIGATDLSTAVYTYNDLPAGQTDVSQNNFSLNGPDLTYLIPVIKEILLIVPSMKIIATPWSAPAWMKTNNSLSGGNLKAEYYDSYALYFVKYLQAMKAQGINIYAITPQNEPEHCCNNPAMLMTASEQTNFILKLAPAIQNAGFSTKIIVFDHNCDNTDYPTSVLNGPASAFTDGAAFHLYAGNISALSTVHNNTGKNVYFTEQFTGSNGSFVGDLGWHMQNVMLGASNNWAKVVLEWNLANNSTYGPYTPGGCTTCLGALTVASNGSVTRNVAYYIVAHMSKFVRPGAVRSASTSSARDLTCAGFVNSAENGGAKVLVVYNNGQRNTTFNIKYQGKTATVTLNKKSVGSYVWY